MGFGSDSSYLRDQVFVGVLLGEAKTFLGALV